MLRKLKIDFVSDIACPWCVIGLRGLEKALEALKGEIEAEITFHPFELNPNMAAGGVNGLEYITSKYGLSPSKMRENRAMIKDRAAELDFAMNTSDASRVYNTFDAHRLIAWAGEKGCQLQVKKQMFTLYFTNQQDTGDRESLVAAVVEAGLDGEEAREVLASDRYADQVRAEEMLWRQRGINSVPSIVVGERYLISGGQPPEEFIRQLRAISATLDEQGVLAATGA